jgi:hypothetical protein
MAEGLLEASLDSIGTRFVKRGLFGEVSPSVQTLADINDLMAEGLLRRCWIAFGTRFVRLGILQRTKPFQLTRQTTV